MTSPILLRRTLQATQQSASRTTGLLRASMASKIPDWEATRYLRFENERTHPARDLLAQIPLKSPAHIIDLGCGPGNSTELLAARFPDSKLTGMDSSPNMIEKARAVLPNIKFELGDLTTYTPDEPVDLMYSNAVFQWLKPEERTTTIKRLLESQPQGGVFAMQVPDNYNEPSHTAMRETASEPPFAHVFASMSVGNRGIPEPTEWYNVFKPLCRTVDIWHTIYEHRLESHEAIVDWLMSTGLRPFLEPLDGDQRKGFLKRYLEKIKQQYPTLVDGGVLLRFPRLFVVLVK